jgi:hypothetical protein
MNFILRMAMVASMAFVAVGCSTVESRIQSNPLAMGKPDHTRTGVRFGRAYEAWVYTTIQTEFTPNFYPGLYDFGYYRYHRGYPYGGYRHMQGGFYGTTYGAFADNIISYEVPYKTVYFENGRCSGWDNSDS